jgi:uncharacterized membrane protein
MGLIYALLAATLISSANLFMRKSVDAGGSAKGYLFIQMAFGFLLSLYIGPVSSGFFAPDRYIVIFSLIAGLSMGGMLYLLGKALETGPPGLTFSILSSSCVVPAVIMSLIFGSQYGCRYTMFHGIGTLLVLVGLFWASQGLSNTEKFKNWVLFVSSTFILHVALLCFFQWRTLASQYEGLLLPHESAKSLWFMPLLYLTSFIIQSLVFAKEKRAPLKKEWSYGLIGGVLNVLCTLSILKGTEQIHPVFSALVFPVYSVGIIFFSNLWSHYLYSEKVNWKACQICTLGILIGTIDWCTIERIFKGF